MAQKKPNPALENYVFKGTHPAGRCGKTGIEYNLYTVSEKVIEAMITKGSPLFEKKVVKAAKPATDEKK